MSEQKVILACRHITKQYQDSGKTITVFDQLDLEVRRGHSIGIVGKSGAGKTTLLNILGGLDLPTAGEVLFDGQVFAQLRERERCHIRNKEIGFVYQFHHLLPEFTALENVCMPLLIGGNLKEMKSWAETLLERVGLGDRMTHKPSQLSGGERQRVAIARALVNNPACVLMDEPTGNLDEATANEVKAVIHQLKADLATSFVIVTHEQSMADTMDSVFRLEHGKLVNERRAD